MLSRKDIQINLLNKLNDLCEKANVQYVLHGQAAFLAYENKPIDNIASLEVMMCQGDAEKIRDLLNDEDYYFEDFNTNPKFDKHFMMFGYKNSLDLKMKEINFIRTRHIKNNCIHINILFIERLAKEKIRKKLKYEEKFWKLKYLNQNLDILWYLNYGQKLLNIYYKIKGNEKSIQKRYNTKKENFAINTWKDIKKEVIVKVNEKPINSEIFNEIISKEINGVSSYIFKDFDYYAKTFYGENWQTREWKNNLGFTSSIISWEEYSKDPLFKKSVEEIQKRHEIIFYKNRKVKKYKKTINIMKKNVIQSGNIIHLREDLIRQKEEITTLYEQEKIKELGLIFNPLIKSMKIGINLGYTYSIDEEIDIILDSYLREVDEEELANKIKKYRIAI